MLPETIQNHAQLSSLEGSPQITYWQRLNEVIDGTIIVNETNSFELSWTFSLIVYTLRYRMFAWGFTLYFILHMQLDNDGYYLSWTIQYTRYVAGWYTYSS